ncbi:glycoside hydrolase superfamily [Lasiosphaeria ovina]|uniref:Glycoside hydrolase superfamily n=1 Tax=Lasiosphaeria ovina TaxID=92902 RepID=A0AAE0JYI9_9PEZI|nr:glycoside hydrolase superfamily [Lasiosphaeria ovina]
MYDPCVYPASFSDTHGDGLRNIDGITANLDYLLGSAFLKAHRTIWAMIFQTINEIHRPFGTMDDVYRLIDELKRRRMNLVMDLVVVNHTSTHHSWFIDSALSKKPPNSWACLLDDTQSAWTYHSGTDEYYLSLFSLSQADINWENPRGGGVHEIARFWLEKGISGFRMDVINLISKDQKLFPDAEIVYSNKKYQPGDKYFANGARLFEYLQEIERLVFSKYDIRHPHGGRDAIP